MVTREILSTMQRLLRPLRVRMANTLARMIVSLVDDEKGLQLVQLKGPELEEGSPEVIADAEHFQPYGSFAIPLAGAEAIVLFPNGDRGHPLVVAVTDRRYRKAGGQPGEAGIATDEGDEIRLARGHKVVVTTPGQILLGSSSLGATDGVVHGSGIDPFTGLSYTALGNASASVRAKKT